MYWTHRKLLLNRLTITFIYNTHDIDYILNKKRDLFEKIIETG